MAEMMSIDDAMRAVAERCANDESAWRAWLQLHAHLTQPAQAVDVGAIGLIAAFLHAVSRDGEEWVSRDKGNPAVLNIRRLAEKLTAALPTPPQPEE